MGILFTWFSSVKRHKFLSQDETCKQQLINESLSIRCGILAEL